jgi:uracil-DNA glycosylase
MKNSKKKELEKIYFDYCSVFCDELLVFGSGDIDSPVVFIGEAPGKHELEKGKPFVGKAGERFSEILAELGLQREEIYITNAIKHGLRKTDPITGRKSNRPARRLEIQKNSVYLKREVECLKPSILVTLGAVPLRMLLELDTLNMSKYAGKLIRFNDTRLFPMFHPAALIYNRSLANRFAEDIKELKKILNDKMI